MSGFTAQELEELRNPQMFGNKYYAPVTNETMLRLIQSAELVSELVERLEVMVAVAAALKAARGKPDEPVADLPALEMEIQQLHVEAGISRATLAKAKAGGA